MAEHYFDIVQPKRPRVLGMTASPVYESRKAIQAINSLESNLDARLVEVQENIGELAGIARRPNEIVVTYSPMTEVHINKASRIEEIILESAAADLIDHTFRNQLENIKQALGPLGGDYFVIDWLRSHIKRARRSTAELAGYSVDPATIMEWEKVVGEIEVLAAVQKPTGNAISPKVHTLIDVVDRFRSPDFVAVIFVQRRTHCSALMRMLANCDQLAHFIKPVSLMGHGGRAGAVGSMPVVHVRAFSSVIIGLLTCSQQARVVNQLRGGEANVLVATQ